MTAPKISPYRRGLPRFPNDPERRMPGELRTYFLDDAELEELNRKYPPKPREMYMHERAVKLVNDMDRRRAEQIEKMKEGEKGKMAANNREPKITKEQLLKDCREHGTSWDAAKIIADKYGMSKNTIYNYISKWGIRQELQPAPNENKPTSGLDFARLNPPEVKHEPALAKPEMPDMEREAVKELHGGEFQLRRAGIMEKSAIVNMLRNIAAMLTTEADGEYKIELSVTRGRGA